jgi:Uncharacterized protein conserved in bacteria
MDIFNIFKKKEKTLVGQPQKEIQKIISIEKNPTDFEMLPQFPYSPNCYLNDIFDKAGSGDERICDCCDGRSSYYYSGFYSHENVEWLCPECISNGKAAAKYGGSFIQDAESIINDESKTARLFKQTPGYITWQGEYWLTCCNDYCVFLGNTGMIELNEMGIANEVLDDYYKQGAYSVKDVKKHLFKNGNMAGYLFHCEHCGKYRIWVDAN